MKIGSRLIKSKVLVLNFPGSFCLSIIARSPAILVVVSAKNAAVSNGFSWISKKYINPASLP